MTRVAVASSTPRFDLTHQIEQWGHSLVAEVHSQQQLCALSAAVEVVVAEAAHEFVNGEIVSHCAQRGIRMIAVADTPAEHARAAATGVGVVTADELTDKLPELLVGAMLKPTSTAPRLGTIVAIWGAPGAPGASTVALNLAADWRDSHPPARLPHRGRVNEQTASDERICLVDLDCWSPALAPMLGSVAETPGIAAIARLTDHDRLTETEFARLAMPGPNSSTLLTGLTALDRWPELSPQRITRALDALRSWNDVIIVDLGSHLPDTSLVADPFTPVRGAAIDMVLDQADITIGVGAADPVGLARMVRAWPAWGDRVRGRHEYLINRLRGSVLGMQPANQVRQLCRQFIGRDPIALLEDDSRSTDAALLRAEALSVAAPKSALRNGIRDLARAVR